MQTSSAWSDAEVIVPAGEGRGEGEGEGEGWGEGWAQHTRLDQRAVDALDERPAAGGHRGHLDAVARVVEPEARDLPYMVIRVTT